MCIVRSFVVCHKRAHRHGASGRARKRCQTYPSFNLSIDCLVWHTDNDYHSILLLLLLSFCFRPISLSHPLPVAALYLLLRFYPLFMFCVHIFRHGWMRDRGVDSHDRLDSELSRNTLTNTIATLVNGSELFRSMARGWMNQHTAIAPTHRKLNSVLLRAVSNQSNKEKLITISPGRTSATDEHIAMWFHCESVTLPVSFESVRFSNGPVNATKRTTTTTTTTTRTIFPLHRSHTTAHFWTVCWVRFFRKQFSSREFYKKKTTKWIYKQKLWIVKRCSIFVFC